MTEAVEQKGVDRLPGERQLPAEREAPTNGIRLCYLEWEGPKSPTRPPVVVLHGMLQTGEGMANLAAHLARSSRVIAPDLRGRGGSDHPPAGYDPDTMADDVAGLIRETGLVRPVVIGRMHGGLVAYRLAARHPSLLSGLVVGDTAPEVNEVRAANRLALAQTIPPTFANRDEATTYYRETLGLSIARARHDIPFDLIEQDDGSLRWRYDLDIVERIAAASAPRSDWDILARIECPTIFIRGQRGDISPEMVVRLKTTMTKATFRVETVIGARHDVFLGPGTEQAFAALDLFLMVLANGRKSTARVPLAGTGERSASAGAMGQPGQIVEQMVRAINSRDPAVIDTLFAPDCQVRQYAEGGIAREGGPEAALAAFEALFEAEPSGSGEAVDVVAGDRGQVAFVLSIRRPVESSAAPPLLIPIFLTLRDDRIAALTAYRISL
ncbi:MAG: alpha/beta fold hydrolase [Thermomicrobiales bacterium]